MEAASGVVLNAADEGATHANVLAVPAAAEEGLEGKRQRAPSSIIRA